MSNRKAASENACGVRPLREIRQLIHTHLLGGDPTFQSDIVTCVSDLLQAIERGDVNLVNKALNRLGIDPNSELYMRVENLTLSLHSSLKELCDHLARTNYSVDSTNIPEATDKLEQIIDMTFEAGEKTFHYMDLQTDSLRQIKLEIDSLEHQLHSQQEALTSEQLKHFIDRQRTLLQDLAKTTLDIVVAQEYQDLTGQILKKVTKLLRDIERQLLSLISIFAVSKNTPDSGKSCIVLDQKSADALLEKSD